MSDKEKQIKFSVIDNKTGEYPDLYNIALKEAISNLKVFPILAINSLYFVSGVILFPVGRTSISLRMIPDFASVIFTGLFVPMNRKVLNFMKYNDLCFSFTVIVS